MNKYSNKPRLLFSGRLLIVTLVGAQPCFASAIANHWVATWGTCPSPQLATEAQMTEAHLLFHGQTLGEIVHTSIGGDRIRVRLSNVFGTEAAFVGAVSIETRSRIERQLTFSGRQSVVLPPNAEAISDPVPLVLASASDLAIRIYLPEATRGAAIHYRALQTSYIEDGDQTASIMWPHIGTEVGYWAFLSGVDVEAPATASTIVAFGDSITDGMHSTPGENRRWPDDLVARLLARDADAPERAVLNAGIGGNRLLRDAIKSRIPYGVNALARFDRDVLSQPGVRYVIVLGGINDIIHPGSLAPVSEAVSADDLIWALSQLAERAHEKGVKIIGCTLTPFEGASHGYYTSEKEQVRQKYNAWIRSFRQLDGMVDFDHAIRDPNQPLIMLPAYDSGDHLHPNNAGYQAMAEAINLELFR